MLFYHFLSFFICHLVTLNPLKGAITATPQALNVRNPQWSEAIGDCSRQCPCIACGARTWLKGNPCSACHAGAILVPRV